MTDHRIDIPADQMPTTITTAGGTCYRTGYTGTTLSPCCFGEGHKSHEFWLNGKDTARLHAITATEHWLD